MNCQKCSIELNYNNVCCEEKYTCIDCCGCNRQKDEDSNDNCDCGCNN